MTKRMISAVLAAVCLIALLCAGCSNKDGERSETREIVNREGQTMRIPNKIETIASMAPSVTQVLVDMGYDEHIVAVDENSKKIDGVGSEKSVYDMLKPNAEQLIALKPDIVFVSSMSKWEGESTYQTISDAGIAVVYIPMAESFADIKKDILFYDEVLGTQAGQALLDTMQKKIDEVKRAVSDIPDDDKKSVYFEIGSEPALYSFGKNVFLNEMIDLAGGKNILSDLNSWVAVSPEQVVSKNPQVIFTNIDYVDHAVDLILQRQSFAQVDALKNKRVYFIDPAQTSQPNHKSADALEAMAKAMYPDQFSDWPQ